MSTSSITASITASRSLHLVDLENLVGDPFAPAPVVRDTFDLPMPCNVHTPGGRDGADMMLRSFAPPELVARRYARDVGVRVLVVTRPDARSHQFLGLDRAYVAAPTVAPRAA